MIVKAKTEDIILIQELLKKSFDKFGLSEYFQDYDEKTIYERLSDYYLNENFLVLLNKDKQNNILGVMILIIYPQIFNKNRLHINDLTIQPDPDLSEKKQAKILIEFINYIEKLGKEKKAKTIGITISPKFNIGKYLIKNKFINCDLNYIKEVK
jgi:hypothetical protein